MDESFPAFVNPSQNQQEISHSVSSQKENDDFLLEAKEPVTNRRSGHLTSAGTRRYGMMNFDDMHVREDLLQEFDPLSQHTDSVHIQCEQNLSRDTNKELSRGSRLILDRMQETTLANAGENVGEGLHENDGISESCEGSNEIDETVEVADEGEYSHVVLTRLPNNRIM